MNLNKYNKNFFANNTNLKQTELEIQGFIANTGATFSDEFLSLIRLGTSGCFTYNDFKIINNIPIYKGLSISALPADGRLHDFGFYGDGLEIYQARIEDFDKFYIFGSNFECQPFIIGIHEPFIDQVYILNSDHDFKDEPIRIDPDGFKVYPKHFLANSFVEFIDLLYEHRIKDQDEE